jgi:outer membrane protein OmpA-like peptidoglycan-associated protein
MYGSPPREGSSRHDRVMSWLPCRLHSCLALLSLVSAVSYAGDPVAVERSLERIRSSWPAAQLSVDIKGLADRDATVDQSLVVEYESAQSGYMAYLRVSAHGDMSLTRTAGSSQASGSQSRIIKPPLGGELLFALYLSQPLDSLFADGGNDISLGSDGARANEFVDSLERLRRRGAQIAVRKHEYMVVSRPGGTEYTTRGIIRQIEQSRTKAAGPAKTGMPSRIGFEFDSDQLTTQGKYDLDVFGAALVRDLKGTQVTLVGHTDDLGAAEYNQSLSQRRAAAARQYLIASFGLPPATLTALGKGEEDAIVPNGSEAERSRNRRVDFIFSIPGSSK